MLKSSFLNSTVGWYTLYNSLHWRQKKKKLKNNWAGNGSFMPSFFSCLPTFECQHFQLKCFGGTVTQNDWTVVQKFKPTGNTSQGDRKGTRS